MEPIQPPDPQMPRLPPPSPPPPPGAPPFWTGAPAPYGGQPPPTAQTYGLATAALVCGLAGLVTFWIFGIVPLLGVVFGLISAKAIKNSDGRFVGLGKARAGWIFGLIGLAGGAVMLWAGVTGRLDDETSKSSTTELVDTDSNPRTSTFANAKVGDCISEFPAAEVVYELEFVPCSTAHGAEVYLIGELNPDGTRDYPGNATLIDEVSVACEAGFEPYVGRSYAESVFEVYYLYPRALGWRTDGGTYLCFVGEVGKDTVGSAYQSDR